MFLYDDFHVGGIAKTIPLVQITPSCYEKSNAYHLYTPPLLKITLPNT